MMNSVSSIMVSLDTGIIDMYSTVDCSFTCVSLENMFYINYCGQRSLYLYHLSNRVASSRHGPEEMEVMEPPVQITLHSDVGMGMGSTHHKQASVEGSGQS